MYQRKVDVDMLNVVKSVLADISSISPSSEQRLPLPCFSVKIKHKFAKSFTLFNNMNTTILIENFHLSGHSLALYSSGFRSFLGLDKFVFGSESVNVYLEYIQGIEDYLFLG